MRDLQQHIAPPCRAWRLPPADRPDLQGRARHASDLYPACPGIKGERLAARSAGHISPAASPMPAVTSSRD
eukprot:7257531-Heterocapsa_arctica.AAC.1